MLVMKRVKISSTNIRLETTVPQKEETFQVVIDIIKNSMCFKAFTISAYVPEIIAAILIHHKEGVDFTDVPDNDTKLTFLIDLGYKGPLNRHTNMFVDHMHQLWRTLAAIINKCLSGKTASNDKLRKFKAKKTADEYQETVDVSEESEPEPEPAKKKTASRRLVKKKVTLSADDNIISDNPDVALELAKSISQTKAEEAEAARQVHATHARIMTESVHESTKKKSGGRSSKSVVIQDTPKAVNIMQSLKESKKTSSRQPGTRGSNQGTGTIPGVSDESTVISATLSEGTGDEQDSRHSDDDNDDAEKDDKDGDDDDDEGDDHVSDTQDADDEDVKTEFDEDDIYKCKISDEEITDATKADAEKTLEAKDDAKKTKLPPSSSSLSISLGFGDQFLKLSSDSSLVSTVKDSADTDASSLLDIPIQQDAPQIRSPSI
ncbi:hypothetical protein Tco_0672597 [Tanacetum coccineum]